MGRDRTRDHVPPQVFFPPAHRRMKNLSKLEVVHAHSKCNGDYKLDEQYFFHSLAPLARRTEVGPAIWQSIEKPILTSRERNLRLKIAGEFSINPVGRVQKRFDKKRIDRVMRKIVRGLWFQRFQSSLPDTWRYEVFLYDPINRPPDEVLEGITNEPSWGCYPEVFFFKTARSSQYAIQAFVFFLWDWFVIPVFVHDPTCKCPRCGRTEGA